MSGFELLFDSNRGVYIPKYFAQACGHWQNLPEDFEDMLGGPEAESYWDIWTDTLDNATYTDSAGNVWHLWQDGDLWAYCEELMNDSEYQDFFGEPKA